MRLKILDRVPDHIARQVLDEFDRAAIHDALPGFEGDPRGRGVVEMWRRSRFPEDYFLDKFGERRKAA